MQYEGTLSKKLAERSGVSQRTGQAWKMADYLVEEGGTMYPKHIVFKVSDGTVDRIAKFDAMIGKEVIIDFGIDAHESDGRWYNDIVAYGIRAKEQTQAPAAAPGQAPAQGQAQQPAAQGSDGLPF